MFISQAGYINLLFLLLLGCVSTHSVNTTNAVIKLHFEHPGLLPGHAADSIDIIWWFSRWFYKYKVYSVKPP